MLDDIAWDMGAMDMGIKDVEGNWYPEDTYFKRQYGFCEGQREQHRALDDFVERKERRVYEKRLKKDFFPNSWDYLAIKTQQALLYAEQKWDTSADIGSGYDSLVVEYRRALEIELREAIFSHAANVVDKMIKGKKLRGPTGVSYSPSNLTLNHMRSLLNDIIAGKADPYTSELKKCLCTIPMTSANKIAFNNCLLCGVFVQFLSKLNKLRNDYEHTSNTEVGEALREIRNKILGIGNVGYLPLLASIKSENQVRAT